MVRFECDTCARLKEDNELWILGFAAESIGITAARREITIASAWDNARAVDWLAVHFCSDECRAEYVERLFSDRVVLPESRKQRANLAVPSLVETVIAKKSTSVRTPRKKRA